MIFIELNRETSMDYSTPINKVDEQVNTIINAGHRVAVSDPVYYRLPGGIVEIQAERWHTTEHKFTRYTFAEVGNPENSWQTVSWEEARKLEDYLGIDSWQQ